VKSLTVYFASCNKKLEILGLLLLTYVFDSHYCVKNALKRVCGISFVALWLERSPAKLVDWVCFSVGSYQSLKKWYLPLLLLSCSAFKELHRG